MPPLYKTVVVVWTPTPDVEVGVKDLDKPSYCAKNSTELVAEPLLDPDWDPDVVFIDGDFHVLDERNKS